MPLTEPSTSPLSFRSTGGRGCFSPELAYIPMRHAGTRIFQTRRNALVPGDWENRDNVVAAVATCPLLDCGALVLAFRASQDATPEAEPWYFTCPRCGFEFEVRATDKLILHSIPRNWLVSNLDALKPSASANSGVLGDELVDSELLPRGQIGPFNA
jgi:hypothetical protein